MQKFIDKEKRTGREKAASVEEIATIPCFFFLFLLLLLLTCIVSNAIGTKIQNVNVFS